jgi:hypothetical protein
MKRYLEDTLTLLAPIEDRKLNYEELERKFALEDVEGEDNDDGVDDEEEENYE